MQRIVGRDVFEGKPSEDYTLTVHELGHGHREAVVQRCIDWEHVCTMSDEAFALYEIARCRPDPDKDESNALRAARRAKTDARRRCKAMGVDTMLTLTYRENQTDLALCKKHLDLFRKRMQRAFPGFAYVAAFEQQKRGAWHVHLAIHALPIAIKHKGIKIKSWSVVRSCWQGVVGVDNGNVDFSRRRKQKRRSPARMASYMSKYMLKAFTDSGGAFGGQGRRWSSTQVTMPPAVRERFRGAALHSLIELAYSFAADGSCDVATGWLSPFKDSFFLATEPPDPRKRPPQDLS